MSRECIFCGIAKGEIPANIIFQNDGACAFLDIAPRAPGHIVIVPRIHAETILDADTASLEAVLALAKESVRILKVAFDPLGFTIGINHGREAGQIVPHLHMHVIPRFAGDGGKSLHDVVLNTNSTPLAEIYEKIKKYL
jgi:histidine triad (HIT) family protein